MCNNVPRLKTYCTSSRDENKYSGPIVYSRKIKSSVSKNSRCNFPKMQMRDIILRYTKFWRSFANIQKYLAEDNVSLQSVTRFKWTRKVCSRRITLQVITHLHANAIRENVESSLDKAMDPEVSLQFYFIYETAALFLS